jgi:hypothetical protein
VSFTLAVLELTQMKMTKQLYVLIALLLHMIKTFVLSNILEYTYKSDVGNAPSGISAAKSESLITCATYCSQIITCVAFMFNNGNRTCYTLDKILTSTGNLASNGESWMYYEKRVICK